MLWWWSLAHAASTCDPPLLRELAMDPGSSDAAAPPAPVFASLEVQRGVAASKGIEADDCPGLGAITITVQGGSSTGTTSSEAVGYQLALTDGDLPDGMDALPATVLSGPDVTFYWDDGAVNDQDAFYFQVGLQAVDAAGNEGGVLLVDVADDGIAAAACDTTGAPAIGLLGLAAPLVGLRRIRPRARG